MERHRSMEGQDDDFCVYKEPSTPSNYQEENQFDEKPSYQEITISLKHKGGNIACTLIGKRVCLLCLHMFFL